MKDEFLALYKKDFEITGGSKMETILGMVVEQKGKSIKFTLIITSKKSWQSNSSNYIKKSLRP